MANQTVLLTTEEYEKLIRDQRIMNALFCGKIVAITQEVYEELIHDQKCLHAREEEDG